MKKTYTSILIASGLSLAACDAIFTKTASQGEVQSSSQTVAAGAQNTQRVNSQSLKPIGYLLDINEATYEDMARVPGFTPKIKDLVENTRPFLDMIEIDDELDMLGVSNKKRKDLYTHLFMVIDINNGEMQDLKFVPQLSNSLASEIVHGRPYKSRAELEKVIEASVEPDQAKQLMSYFKVEKIENKG